MNCVYGKKENSDEIIGSNSICFESSLNLNSKTSICYAIVCDRINKRIIVNVGDKNIICPGTKNVLNNPGEIKGTLTCPDYNMVCTTDKWCNNIYDCIDKQSESDLNTYDFISNRDELEKRDKENLNINSSFKFELKWITLIMNFLIMFNLI